MPQWVTLVMSYVDRVQRPGSSFRILWGPRILKDPEEPEGVPSQAVSQGARPPARPGTSPRGKFSE